MITHENPTGMAEDFVQRRRAKLVSILRMPETPWDSARGPLKMLVCFLGNLLIIHEAPQNAGILHSIQTDVEHAQKCHKFLRDSAHKPLKVLEFSRKSSDYP